MALIVVIGAGIAGLASALALRRFGEVVVLERRSAAEANFGAGIQVSPNAVKALRALGAADRVTAVATAPDGLLVRSGRQVVVRLPYRPTMETRFGAPYLTLSRAALHEALSDCVAAHAIPVHFDQECEEVEVRGADIVVPHIGRTALIIAADGVRSGMRGKIVGDKPLDSGWTAWRGRGSKVEGGDTELILGAGHHLVRYPLSGDGENCVLMTRDPAAPDTIARTATGRFIADVADWQPWTMRTRLPHVFNVGRVAFVGDASHATLPFIAQGGALALEDAATLGAAVKRDGLTPAALSAYAAMRRERVRRTLALSEQQGRIYHLPFPLSLARDIALRRMGPESILRRMAPVWSWAPPD